MSGLVRVRVYDGRRVVQDDVVVLDTPKLEWVEHGFMVGVQGSEKRQKVKIRFDFDPPLDLPEAPEDDE